MGQVESDHARDDEQLEQIASALGEGVVLVDAHGHVVWLDKNTRRRINGGLEHIMELVRAGNRSTLDCAVSAVRVTIGGEPVRLCIIQERGSQKEAESDVVAAIEAALADPSSLTRMVVERFRALRYGRRAPARPSDLDVLTDREREVLGLICEGHSDAQMGALLNVSQNTVRNHIASLYRKIGVNRRSAAIIWARERGITSHKALELRGRRRPRPPSDLTNSY